MFRKLQRLWRQNHGIYKEPQMKKLYSSPSKLAALVGIKTMDMKDFLTSLAKHVKSEQRSFVGKDGKVDYIEFETIKALAYYETYAGKIAEMKDTLKDVVIAETEIPNVMKVPAVEKKQKPSYKPEKHNTERLPLEIDVDPEEIPF